MTGAELAGLTWGDILVQPRVDFRYEVSFYNVDDAFQYALYAPDPDRRWVLEPYEASEADLAFARRFIDWNTLDHGIQRVDACRTRDGTSCWSSWRTSTRFSPSTGCPSRSGTRSWTP